VSDLRRRMEFAADAARGAGEVVMRFFQKSPAVESKADRTPVTEADRAAERFLRERIRAAFPRDGLLGEEFGEVPGESGRRWLIDPIDGTKSFIQGVPLFGVVLGVEGPDGPEAGAVYLPALDELVCAARGEGAWWNGARARVSAVDRLDQACVIYTTLRTFDQAGPEAAAGGRRLFAACRLQRGWGDCYGHMLVATGRAEVMLDPVLNPWDSSPFPAILEEAGGTFTDWGGRRTIHGGSGISTNGRLFPEVQAILHPAAGGGPPIDPAGEARGGATGGGKTQRGTTS
jgi:histidinol-phosphatase